MAEPDQPHAADRRDFLARSLAVAAGGVVGAAPVAAGVCVFLDPLNRASGLGDWVRVTTLNSLPADGVPRQFPVISDRADAWNRYPQEPIGAVYLARSGSDEVSCFNAVCPHAGCFVDARPAAQQFRCPCHDSAFEFNGRRVGPDCPSPRDLDSLEVDATRLAAGEVWVRFQNYRAGKAEKIAET